MVNVNNINILNPNSKNPNLFSQKTQLKSGSVTDKKNNNANL